MHSGSTPTYSEAYRSGPVRRLVTGAVPLALGVAALLASLNLPVGSLTRPGSGFWPLVVSVALIASSLAVFASGADEDEEPFTRESLRTGAVLAGLVAFVVLFTYFGFVLPATLLLVFWLRWISHESWRMTVAVTVSAVTVFYVLFAIVLGVPFPYDIIVGR